MRVVNILESVTVSVDEDKDRVILETGLATLRMKVEDLPDLIKTLQVCRRMFNWKKSSRKWDVFRIRNREIANSYKTGLYTMDQLAGLHKVSRGRIQQIISKEKR